MAREYIKGRTRKERMKIYNAKPERVAQAKARYEANKDKISVYSRNQHRLRTYGITEDDFNNMVNLQEGKCAICNKHFDNTPFIDHKHIEGFESLPREEKRKYVRGLLCNDCNTLIAFAYDDVEILHNSIKYLNNFKEKSDE